MGHKSSKGRISEGHQTKQTDISTPKFKAFQNKYETLEQVQEALQKAGLESSHLIVGRFLSFYSFKSQKISWTRLP
jgi:hypothetical protein